MNSWLLFLFWNHFFYFLYLIFNYLKFLFFQILIYILNSKLTYCLNFLVLIKIAFLFFWAVLRNRTLMRWQLFSLHKLIEILNTCLLIICFQSPLRILIDLNGLKIVIICTFSCRFFDRLNLRIDSINFIIFKASLYLSLHIASNLLWLLAIL